MNAPSALAAESKQESPENLLARIAKADTAALDALYAQTIRRVYALVSRVLHNAADAEEVCLDVFHQIWQQSGSYNPERGSVLNWVLTIAWSRAIDRQRRLQRASELFEVHPEPAELAYTDISAKHYDDAVDADAVRRGFVDVLSDAQRQVLELTYMEQLSHSEVAERLNMPLGTVKSHAKRALDVLREKYR